MIEKINQTEEIRQQLLAEIASMKKQSLFSLIFAVVCIVVMVYFYAQLQATKVTLEASNVILEAKKQELQLKNDTLKLQKNKLDTLVKALDNWRNYVRELKAQPLQEIERHRKQLPTKASAFAPTFLRQEAAPIVLLASISPGYGITERVHRKVIYYQPVASPAIQPAATPAISPFFGYIIYIKDARLTKDAKKNQALETLQKRLKDAVAIVPGVQAVNSSRTSATQVKYFYKSDEKTAHEAAKLLSGLVNGTVGVVQESQPRMSRGQLEVWLGDQ